MSFRQQIMDCLCYAGYLHLQQLTSAHKRSLLTLAPGADGATGVSEGILAALDVIRELAMMRELATTPGQLPSALPSAAAQNLIGVVRARRGRGAPPA